MIVKTLSVFFSFFIINSFFCNAANNHVGLWYTKDKKCVINIEIKDGKYFGKIVWLKSPYDENGNPRVDKNNKDKSLRNQSALGMNILQNLVLQGNVLKGGNVYDPLNGKTYNATVEHNNDRLYVRGYIGIALFGRTEIWNRCNSIPGITSSLNTLNICNNK